MYVSKYIANNKPTSNSTETFHFLDLAPVPDFLKVDSKKSK